MRDRNNVCLPEPLTKDKFQQLLAIAWGRVGPTMTFVKMASRMALKDPKTLSRAVACENLPEAHTVFNSLCADETALREIMAHYGYELSRVKPEAANDFITLHGVCEVAAELSEALRDGVRDHNETLHIADKLRPHMPSLIAYLNEADALRGAA
ncbi:hypothetical protein [Sphingomonas sp. 10B4]|uniref:hypothetical protein n=1 Tax=Sphingomonas sp. 10B4 TaxID=3048575 RepID=UPI002AB54724|nr:hypothetical protein [Sphingomonas sp. 10B4]MDY7525511.1 hypothetical protein [Sphingomonas sp. 10B4]MEB0281457.1 hypothetical protein [Sphingomonas sp. 10B4]